MRRRLAAYLDRTLSSLIYLVVGLTPLIFSSQTTEPFDLPKLLFLVASALILVFLWALSGLVRGRFYILKSPLNLPLLCLLIVVLVSSAVNLKSSGYPTIFGNFPDVHDSAIAWVTYIILYFVIISNLIRPFRVKHLLYSLILSTGVVCVVTILSYFGITWLPFNFTNSSSFTPTGSAFSTLSLVLLVLPALLIYLIQSGRRLALILVVILLTLFGVTLALTGSLMTDLVALAILVTSLFLTPHKQIKRLFLIILIPVSVTLFLITLPTTSGVSSFNFIKAQELNYPREVKLPLTTSWKISSQVFSNAPILGTGPSTFLFDFTKYKPSEFNSTQLWDSSFNTAADEFLQVFATLGLLGVLVFIWISLVVLLKGLGYLVKHSYDESPASSRLMQSLALMSLVAIALMLLHALTLVSTFVTLVILAAFMTYQLVDKGKFAYYSLGFTIILGKKSRLDLIPIILFALCLASVLPVWKRIYNIAAADYYHHLAVNDMRSSGALAYRNLQMAETLNGKIDLYRVDLAQTNLGLADAIAKQKIYQASASSYLSASDEKTIQILLAQAISEAKAATTLSPLSANNWAVLGAVYKDIIKLSSNATTFALDAYHHAMDQDPLNPSLRVDAGNIYYSVKAYSSAIDLFQQAINLKSDYAPAFYALSLTYRDKGDLQNAEAAAEQAVSLLAADKSSSDYKIAYANLAALKSQAASVSAAPASSSSKVKSK